MFQYNRRGIVDNSIKVTSKEIECERICLVEFSINKEYQQHDFNVMTYFAGFAHLIYICCGYSGIGQNLNNILPSKFCKLFCAKDPEWSRVVTHMLDLRSQVKIACFDMLIGAGGTVAL